MKKEKCVLEERLGILFLVTLQFTKQQYVIKDYKKSFKYLWYIKKHILTKLNIMTKTSKFNTLINACLSAVIKQSVMGYLLLKK